MKHRLWPLLAQLSRKQCATMMRQLGTRLANKICVDCTKTELKGTVWFFTYVSLVTSYRIVVIRAKDQTVSFRGVRRKLVVFQNRLEEPFRNRMEAYVFALVIPNKYIINS
jgi:hypothetical protein